MSDSTGATLDPSTLGVSIELIPLPIQVSLDHLKAIYMEVSSICGYENFTRVGEGARLETAASPEKGASRVTFSRDRITFQEEGATVGSDLLTRKIHEVVRSLAKRVQVPVIVARTRNHRTLISVPGEATASDWLSLSVINVEQEAYNPLGRPVRASGIRLQMPAQKNDEAMHLLRIEEWLKNPRLLFVEDTATWRAPMPLDQISRLAGDFKEAEELMVVNIPAWLASL